MREHGWDKLRRLAARTVRAALLPVAVAAVAACSGGGPGDAGATASWLYVAQADGESSFDAVATALVMPIGRVHAFTDRPYRETRQLSPLEFVALWEATGTDSFAQDPPNAVLTYWDPSRTPSARSVVCELVGPPSFDLRSSMMTVPLRVLDPAGASIPSGLSEASLFIDSGAAPCAASDDFEAVQWFNMENFDQNYGVGFYVGDNTWHATAACDDQSMAPAYLDVRISQPGTPGTYAGCASGGQESIMLDLSSCTGGPHCTLQVTAVNVDTGVVYSQTDVEVLVATGTVSLDLDPAAAPPCG